MHLFYAKVALVSNTNTQWVIVPDVFKVDLVPHALGWQDRDLLGSAKNVDKFCLHHISNLVIAHGLENSKIFDRQVSFKLKANTCCEDGTCLFRILPLFFGLLSLGLECSWHAAFSFLSAVVPQLGLLEYSADPWLLSPGGATETKICEPYRLYRVAFNTSRKEKWPLQSWSFSIFTALSCKN